MIHVRAPATTANLGAGFDCAGAALDLWNELELVESGEAEPDHLAVRAFARLASPDGFGFSITERIPRARGLGSSAATVALGLVAGAAVAGRATDSEELLALGLDLEGHPDNLAAALAGGVCLTWEGRVVRIAEDAPGVPIAIVPRDVTVETHAARAALPETISHQDAAFSVARAALLGAAVASGSTELFAAAADDRLHEPYRAQQAPVLAAVREQLPDGALGATLSGSGPTVIEWARPESAIACTAELTGRFPDTDVLHLSISPTGAGQL